MKFNMSKYLKKTAMPVPLPNPDTIRKMREEGYGLARDLEKEKAPDFEGVDPTLVSQMGLDKGESLRYVPLKESMEYQGRTVHPIKTDKEFLIALDPNQIPGTPEEGGPSNYLKIPLNDPAVVEFLARKSEGFQPHRKDMEALVKDWNQYLRDLDTPGKFSGVNIVQMPLMIFKEKNQIIAPRLAELQAMEASTLEKTQQAVSPAMMEAEIEWRNKINNHELNFQDTVDTIKKLYKGREAQLLEDVNSGALDPSDDWKDIWLEENIVQGEDGQAKTYTLLQRYVELRLKEKEDERNKPEVIKPEVEMPGEILEELPSKSPVSSVSTFTGPSGNIASQNIAILVGIRDEIKDLQDLDNNLSKAANEIAALQSKSDNYLLQHPEEYQSILNTIERDASLFVRRYAKSIQNASKRTAKQPTDWDSWSDAKRNQVKRDEKGGYIVPGAINANFLGKNIASAGVSIYLLKIIAMIRKVDERLKNKGELVQASSKTVKTAQLEFKPNPAKVKNVNELKITALKRLEWIEESEEKVSKVFESIAGEVGAGPDAGESLSKQLKVDMIEKAINQMDADRLTVLIKLLSSI